jgi:hypothetical protein
LGEKQSGFDRTQNSGFECYTTARAFGIALKAALGADSEADSNLINVESAYAKASTDSGFAGHSPPVP